MQPYSKSVYKFWMASTISYLISIMNRRVLNDSNDNNASDLIYPKPNIDNVGASCLTFDPN